MGAGARTLEGSPRTTAASASINTNYFGINTGSKTAASSTQAAIQRGFYQDYQTRFQPIENYLLASSDPNFAANLAGRAQGGVGDSFASAQGTNQRQLNSYGINLSQEEQGSVDRTNNINKSLASVNAYNSTLDSARDTRYGLLGSYGGK